MFALLKRGIMGWFYHTSKQQLHRFWGEISCCWNYRSLSDSEGAEVAIRQAEGKRLTDRKRMVG